MYYAVVVDVKTVKRTYQIYTYTIGKELTEEKKQDIVKYMKDNFDIEVTADNITLDRVIDADKTFRMDIKD